MTGKRLVEAVKKVPQGKVDLDTAINFLQSLPKIKFDETLDAALNLNIDTKGGSGVRGVVSLPGGTGKQVRVAVFAKGEKATEAKETGADFVGDDDLFTQVEKGEIVFERCIATPDMMGLVGRLGRVLGPKGFDAKP